MKDIMDEHNPGWSWEIIKQEIIYQDLPHSSGSTINMAKYCIVHGRLKFIDEGVPRMVDAVAAHRIQVKSDLSDYVDMGNDIKSANTDCMKKALSIIGVASDVYNEDDDLPEELIVEIYALFNETGKDPEKFKLLVDSGKATMKDLSEVKAKLIIIKETESE